MVQFHDKPSQLAMIAGKYVMSYGCTDVLGGTLTAGTPDNESSALLTWAPPFVSAPTVIGTINSGGSTTTSPVVRFSGLGVSNVYISLGESPLTNVTIGVVLVGEARL